MKIEHISLVSDDFKLLAKGHLSTVAEDPMPFGEINVDIKNAGAFLTSDLVPQNMRAAFVTALSKITGQAIEESTNVNVPLRREKNGVFRVGNTTFELLTATVMKELLQVAPPVQLTLPPKDSNDTH